MYKIEREIYHIGNIIENELLTVVSKVLSFRKYGILVIKKINSNI